MDYLFLIVTIALAIIDWVAVAKSWRKLEYIAKPGVMISLLVWVGINHGFQGQMRWFVLGLLFSLAGDIFLILPKEQFLAGLGAFLAGHSAYIVGFAYQPTGITLPILLLTTILIISGIQVFSPLARGCISKGQREFRIPSLIYLMTISLMLLAALTTLARSDWQLVPATLVSTGALLFYFSDLMLGCQRFITRITNGRLVVMITYHLGQIGITWGALLQFLGK